MSHPPSPPSPEEEAGHYRGLFEAAPDGLILIDLESGIVVDANPAARAMHGFTREAFIGLRPADFLELDSQLAFDNSFRAFRAGSVFDIQLQHVRQDGSTFHAEWRGTAIPHQGRPCLLGVVRDVSKRIQADLRLNQRVEARTREQSALLEVSHALASTLELYPGVILDQLRGIVEYEKAGLFALTDSTLSALALRGTWQEEPTAFLPIHLEGPQTVTALLNAHRPIRISDVGSDDPAAVSLRRLLTGEAAVLLQGVGAWMWVPLAVKGRILGGLGLAHSHQDYFTPHQAALTLSMADQVAITMVNAELYERARTLAALQERQRLAQNLHDAVNQSLFSAGLIAEVLPRLWELDPVEARASLQDLRRLTRGALAEMREMLAELRPSVLSDSSLSDLLRQLAYVFTGRTNVPASLTTTGEHILPADIQVALYRICQEAFNNIAKHAEASNVEVDLKYDTSPAQVSSSGRLGGVPQERQVNSVEMRIRDDGRGFDASQPAASGHYGLVMMRERAEAVGARMTVTSRPGHGTEVTLLWQSDSEPAAR
jgi:two-component system nitrate/nitrite sensor histidine kinase NarX